MRETSSILKINLPSIRNSCLKNHKVGLTLNIKADVAFCNILVGHLWKPCLEHVQHSAELGTKNQWRWRNCAYNDLLHTFYKLYRIYIYTHTRFCGDRILQVFLSLCLHLTQNQQRWAHSPYPECPFLSTFSTQKLCLTKKDRSEWIQHTLFLHTINGPHNE